jgi:hypothetical protein
VGDAGDQRAFFDFVAVRDAVCPVCSYCRRGLQKPVCPECGAALHLQVGSENLRLGAWFVSVVSLALGLGFDGVVSLIVLGALVFLRPPSLGTAWPAVRILLLLAIMGALCGAGLILLFRRRRGWARLTRAGQWSVAAALFLGTGVAHSLVGLYLATRR